MATPDSEHTPVFTKKGRVAVVAAGILIAGGMIMSAAVRFGRQAGEAPAKRPVSDVELYTAVTGDERILLESQGLVQAATVTRAAAEVPGRIIKVSPAWEAGGSFNQGEELLQIDDADYKAALASAEASASEAALAIKVEEERGKQAARDWDKLGTGKPDSELVTRAPHLAAAKARSTAALAAVEKARRDLERTTLRAPYAGRILAILTDTGSYAAPASPLADFYSTDAFQINLPLSLDDYHLLDMSSGAEVQLTAGTREHPVSFKGKVVRTSAEIDRASRTIQIVVEIRPGENPPPLLVPGLFVRASLPGRTLKNVVRLPRVSLLPDDRVAIVTAENRLSFRTVKVERSARDYVLLSEGVKAGERVLATPLAVVTEGMEVNPVTLPATAINTPSMEPEEAAEPATVPVPVTPNVPAGSR